MSRAFVSEGGALPQVFSTEESARSAIELARAMDGEGYQYELRRRERGGFMVARLTRDGQFDSWVEQ